MKQYITSLLFITVVVRSSQLEPKCLENGEQHTIHNHGSHICEPSDQLTKLCQEAWGDGSYSYQEELMDLRKRLAYEKWNSGYQQSELMRLQRFRDADRTIYINAHYHQILQSREQARILAKLKQELQREKEEKGRLQNLCEELTHAGTRLQQVLQEYKVLCEQYAHAHQALEVAERAWCDLRAAYQKKDHALQDKHTQLTVAEKQLEIMYRRVTSLKRALKNSKKKEEKARIKQENALKAKCQAQQMLSMHLQAAERRTRQLPNQAGSCNS